MAKLTKGDLVEYEGKDHLVVGFDEINESYILKHGEDEQITVALDQITIVEEAPAKPAKKPAKAKKPVVEAVVEVVTEVVTEVVAEDEVVEAVADEVVAEADADAVVEDEQLDELTKAGETIKGHANWNTTQMTSSVIKTFAGKSPSEQTAFFDAMMSIMHNGDWGIPGGTSSKNKSGTDNHNPHPDTKTPGQMAANVKAMSREDLEAILGDQTGLSEEFKENAATLFEASVNLRVATLHEEMQAEYSAKLDEQMAELTESLTESTEAYLNRAAEKWLEENQVAVESTLRNEVTENFMHDLFGLFKEYNFDVPEGKVDVVETLTAKVEDLEEKLNEQINSNMELCGAIEEFAGERAFDSVCEGLALTQIEKFKTLTEDVKFDGDEESFIAKLEVVKEHHFGGKRALTSALNEEVDIEEDKKPTQTDLDPSMVGYMSAISKTKYK
jgi:hypothetical protein